MRARAQAAALHSGVALLLAQRWHGQTRRGSWYPALQILELVHDVIVKLLRWQQLLALRLRIEHFHRPSHNNTPRAYPAELRMSFYELSDVVSKLVIRWTCCYQIRVSGAVDVPNFSRGIE